jgi:hypothetical protein
MKFEGSCCGNYEESIFPDMMPCSLIVIKASEEPQDRKWR